MSSKRPAFVGKSKPETGLGGVSLFVLKSILGTWYYYARLHVLAVVLITVLAIASGQLFTKVGLAILFFAALYVVLFYLHKRLEDI